jgi:uncharacterized protein (DUF849 family)
LSYLSEGIFASQRPPEASEGNTVLIKACLNGGSDHRAAPVTPGEMAADARAVVAAGAQAIHVHPRSVSGAQSLDAADVLPAVAAIRAAVPGTPVGVTTGIWAVDGDPGARLRLVAAWDGPDIPDFASINLNEPGCDDLATLLLSWGVGIEAGIWVPEDVNRLAASSFADRILRVLIEPEDATGEGAVATTVAIEAALARIGVNAPTVAHGYGLATWDVIRRCLARRTGFRVGLEDTAVLPDGSPAGSNAELVAAAVALARFSGWF